ncbi:DUF4924 family protein [Bacteroidota bacterium]
MIIAKEKRYTNIAEYILYMWQIEDIIRAYKFDIDEIEKNIISKYDQPENILKEIRYWYISLIEMMTSEEIRETGHMQIINTTVMDLYSFHLQLLKNNNEKKYIQVYESAKENIGDFESKLEQTGENEIQTCLTALYAILLMRLQKKEIYKETENAIQSFSNLLALLSEKYKLFEKGKLDIYN